VLEGAAHLETNVRPDPLERGAQLDEPVTLLEQVVVAVPELARRDAEQLRLVGLSELCACPVAQLAGERARVGAEHAQHKVHDARAARGLVRVARGRLHQGEVAEHAEQREERERREAPRALLRDASHQLEDARVLDAIELGTELERGERVEERRVRDLALRRAEERAE
jgi:hypothetical protein